MLWAWIQVNASGTETQESDVYKRQHRFGKLTVQPGLLAIQHLGVDTRLDAERLNWSTMTMPRVDIVGSDGLTLNLTADARYKLNDVWALEASFGTPLITRDARPDGLTRALVANMGLRFAF